VELVAEREDLEMESGAGPDDAAQHREPEQGRFRPRFVRRHPEVLIAVRD
jgi:hypothetical protein